MAPAEASHLHEASQPWPHVAPRRWDGSRVPAWKSANRPVSGSRSKNERRSGPARLCHPASRVVTSDTDMRGIPSPCSTGSAIRTRSGCRGIGMVDKTLTRMMKIHMWQFQSDPTRQLPNVPQCRGRHHKWCKCREANEGKRSRIKNGASLGRGNDMPGRVVCVKDICSPFEIYLRSVNSFSRVEILRHHAGVPTRLCQSSLQRSQNTSSGDFRDHCPPACRPSPITRHDVNSCCVAFQLYVHPADQVQAGQL